MDPKYHPIEFQRKQPKKWPLITLIIILALGGLGGVFWYLNKLGKDQKSAGISTNLNKPTVDFENLMKWQFGFMPASPFFSQALDAGGKWDRPHFEYFTWGTIEKKKGEFDFSATDDLIKKSQEKGFFTVANIQPFVDWDQIACHGNLTVPGGEVGLPEGPSGTEPTGVKGETTDKIKEPTLAKTTKAKPCSMADYKNFLKKLIERYDFDGTDDMPGLKYPIRYFEIMNEPEMNQEPNLFFQGTPDDYFEILKASYETITIEDAHAKVLNAGLASMGPTSVNFWSKVMERGAAKYFDIGNLHSINAGEDLNIQLFKQFLTKYNASDKPIWVTEVSLEGNNAKLATTNEGYAQVLGRAYGFALANGAEKLLYVNLQMPENLPTESAGGPGFTNLSALYDSSGSKTKLFTAHKLFTEKLGGFESVQKLQEEVAQEGRVSRVNLGAYKFKKGDNNIYLFFAKDKTKITLPKELAGNVKVTDISGSKKEMPAANLTGVISLSPIFVEPLH